MDFKCQCKSQPNLNINLKHDWIRCSENILLHCIKIKILEHSSVRKSIKVVNGFYSVSFLLNVLRR